jgi:Glycosyltransferase family 87
MTLRTRRPGATVAGRPIWLLLLAAVGGCLLVIVAAYRWGVPADEHAYWLAARRLLDGLPLYDPNATIVTPYAYLYPPPLAQLLVPVAALVPSVAYDVLWTVGMLVALWWLAGRDLIRALALVAFPPIAVEFWFRNIHLFLAVMVVLGLRRWSGWLSIGAAIKLSPGLGIPFLALRGEWRRAATATALGLVILAASVVASPSDWSAFVSFVTAHGAMGTSGFLPIPFAGRLVIALVLVVVAARLRRPWSDVVFVVAFTVALPALWFTGLSSLVAIVPILREHRAAPRPVLS